MKQHEARPGALDNAYDASIIWRYIAPYGHTLEMCQRPDYWTQNVKELGQQRVLSRHAWNRIEILAEDGTWEADLRVVSISDGLVQTRMLREWHLPKVPGRKPMTPAGYTVEHIHGNGWRALTPGAQVIEDKLPSEEMAMRAASAHAKKVGE